ncbi:MAG: TonB-dependent receptor [Bacteroidota bacterium]|nr:TonB-dependent receptor [Bacteroidota bacterium]
MTLNSASATNSKLLGSCTYLKYLLAIARAAFFTACFLLLSFNSQSQQLAVVQGIVLDSLDRPVKNLLVVDYITRNFVRTNDTGFYRIAVGAERMNMLVFRRDDYSFLQNEDVKPLDVEKVYRLDVKLLPVGERFDPVKISVQRDRGGIVELDPILIATIVGPGDPFINLLKTLGPVASNNELSSQYNVRGGNFDENLIYVNDIEIYRPQLVRNGQQEGLNFVNGDLVKSVKFSAGGFDAKYGDKMSSVLDVTYKEPDTFKASVNANFMGTYISAEGISKNRKFTYLTGFRYRNTAYILNSLDTKGDYKPRYTDFQTLLKWNMTSNWNLSFLGSLAQNRYLSIPQNRTTNFGTVNQAMQLYVGFDGSELMRYNTMMGGLTLGWISNNNRCKLKFIASGFQSEENEYYDVISGYRLSDLETNLASENFGKPKSLRGLGVYFTHGRNDLNIQVFSFQHKGSYLTRKVNILWGANVQREYIKDALYEWNFYDSSDFIVPFKPGPKLELRDFLQANNTLTTNRATAYIQNTTKFKDSSKLMLTYGLRIGYNDVTNQAIISPRANLSWEPNRKYNKKLAVGAKRKKDVLLRASGGMYYQPPFYREYRDKLGVLNLDLQAQRSIHLVLGSDVNFKAWGRPFKFVAETYYKKYDDLVPYDIDNVKIRYFAKNASHGYATGLDLRVNGDFVKDLESWASLSIMKTAEDIDNDDYYRLRNAKGETVYDPNPYDPVNTVVDSIYIHQGFLPRPTDQRFNFNIFFQDYLPKFPSYRMSLNLVAGGKLPFGPPGNYKFRNFFRLPPYRRVDIGFSKMIVDETPKAFGAKAKPVWAKHISSMWVALEVFNLLQFNNSASVFWVKDLQNHQYAVPNYLTGRRLNLHFVIKF